MISYEELNLQNHAIGELSKVLSYLLNDREMCDTQTCCELFYRYMDKVKEHIDVVDKNLYSKLLAHPDSDVKNTAKNFMSGSQEIKHIFNAYQKKWCVRRKDELGVGVDYDDFLKDTEGLFGLVLNRIQNEQERLYPLIREVTGDEKHAA